MIMAHGSYMREGDSGGKGQVRGLVRWRIDRKKCRDIAMIRGRGRVT